MKPCLVSLLPVLQILQGPQPSAGRELAGQQRCAQGEASAEEGTQAEDHADERRRDRAGPAEQGPGRAVAQGEGDPGALGKRACSPRGLLGPPTVLAPQLFPKRMDVVQGKGSSAFQVPGPPTS